MWEAPAGFSQDISPQLSLLRAASESYPEGKLLENQLACLCVKYVKPYKKRLIIQGCVCVTEAAWSLRACCTSIEIRVNPITRTERGTWCKLVTPVLPGGDKEDPWSMLVNQLSLTGELQVL